MGPHPNYRIVPHDSAWAPTFTRYPKYVSLLAPLGYQHRGDTVPGTLYNRKEGPPRMNLHLCVFGGEFWQEHLLFRNYLRSNPEAAAEYESLKRQILVEVGPDPPACNAAKARFIRDVLERATHRMQRLE